MENEKLDIWLKLIQLLLAIASIPIGFYLFFRYESLQRELTIKNLETQSEIAGIKLKKDRSVCVDVQQEIKASSIQEFDDGSFAFNVQISFSIKNLSNHNVVVPYHISNIFIGEDLHGKIMPHVIYPINDPGFSHSGNLTPKGIKWNLARCEIARFSEDITPNLKNISVDSCSIKSGSWGTGPIEPDELIRNDYRFMVRAMPSDYIYYIIGIKYGEAKDISKDMVISDLLTFSELQKR
ncbi:MAG: hypothetical protein D3910_00285 [Candidatus Electrothrix sp. ATG2]|nr:hypothetical protein [Candidatus Electrothrix sp. ATG2]